MNHKERRNCKVIERKRILELIKEIETVMKRKSMRERERERERERGKNSKVNKDE